MFVGRRDAREGSLCLPPVPNHDAMSDLRKNVGGIHVSVDGRC